MAYGVDPSNFVDRFHVAVEGLGPVQYSFGDDSRVNMSADLGRVGVVRGRLAVENA